MDRQCISFEDFQIDPARGELRRGGVVVPVEPQVLDLIAHLAGRAGEIVSRDDLIEHVWGGRIVSDSAIATRINAARAALGDDGSAQRVIKTVSRRGYLFASEVVPVDKAQTFEPSLHGKPSIAVLPFQNMSGDPEQTYFSDGITDDIITDLSRYSELFVIARQSSFLYRDSAKAPGEIANELGVRYIADGTVRRGGDRIRVTVELIDPAAGQQLWADRYDREVTDIFEVQDEIAAMIVNMLAGQIARQHHLRAQGKRPETFDAYDHVLKATDLGLQVSPAPNAEAREAAKKAIAADPGFARAHAMLALTYINEANNFWTRDQQRALDRAHAAARAAVAADDRDPWAYAMLGIADLWRNKAHARAVAHMERAVELNPSSAYFRGLLAYVLSFTGDPDEALRQIDLAIRTSPTFPAVFYGFRGRALLMLRRIDEAVTILEQMVELMPGHSNALGYVALTYAALGRDAEARAAVEELRAACPNYRLGALRRQLPFARPEDQAFVLDNLARAGLPE